MTVTNKPKPSVMFGGGYDEYVKCKRRYRVCKGSRASKKSKNTALNLIYRIMKYPEANALCVRRYANTLRNSVFSDLKWAIHRIGVDDYFECTVSPMEITYTNKSGKKQKILFRGLDDGLKITSISVDQGVLCWVWIEEAYEITNEEDFNMLDESIRGTIPEGLFKQITITFNPWNEHHWLKKRFFDKKDDNVLAITTNYMCNEWLDKSDLQLFEDMKKNNPRRYQVAGLGNWGITEGLIYENWEELIFSVEEVSKLPGVKSVFGLDFGYTNDPTALFCGLFDEPNKVLYVFDELYEKALTNEDIAERITEKGYSKEKIKADSAEPKSIQRLRTLGLTRVKAAKKGRDSVNIGIDYIQCLKIFIHPKCSNFIKEIGNYTWEKDKAGVSTNKPTDDFNHLMDAMRYALEDYMRNKNGIEFLM